MGTRVEKKRSSKKAVPIDVSVCSNQDGYWENECWYPSESFVIKAHDIMIERYGGYTGFGVGMLPFRHLLNKIKQIEGIYLKAAILLKGIATSRIFQDGHHRTAYEVTKAFLEMNGEKMKEKDDLKIIKFIKGIRKYNINKVESWLKNGTLQ
jgi:prophage maintenance system killer protein